MTLLLLFFSILYCLSVFIVSILFLKKESDTKKNDIRTISVVIAARNEENRISSTLESLLKIKYPEDKYEIIFVDDASSDKTSQLIQRYVAKKANWYLIQVPSKSKTIGGKKAALEKGIDKAKGEIILTTDADCTVTENWISEIAGCFETETSMVVGHSLLQRRKGWLNKLIRFDNLFSGVMVAAPTKLGFALNSVGRNMAFRKSAFNKVGGYNTLYHHKSGDDVHLTELFRKTKQGEIKFCFKKDSFTVSKQPDSLRELFHQQIRKNSKLFKKSSASIVLTLFLLAYHLVLIAYPFLYGIEKIWIILLGLKLLSELIALIISAIRFSESRLIPILPLFQILYPLYVSILAFIGTFQLYEWKK